MVRSRDITSFTEHRRHLRDHLTQVRETGRPLFVTTNGETDAVVLSPEAYDALAALADKAQRAESRGGGGGRAGGRPTAGGGQVAKQSLGQVARELGL